MNNALPRSNPCGTSFLKGPVLGLLLAAAVATTASAADVAYYGFFKSQLFQQSGQTEPVQDPGPEPWFFSAVVQQLGLNQGQILSAEASGPKGKLGDLLGGDMDSESPYFFGLGFVNPADLALAAPAGTYRLLVDTLNDGKKDLVLSVPPDAFPEFPPFIVNWEEAQRMDPAAAFVLRWKPFAGGTKDDYIFVQVGTFRSAVYEGEPGHPYLDGTATSIEVPAGSVPPHSEGGFGTIQFEKDLVKDRTQYPGAVGYVGFLKSTSFTVNTLSQETPQLRISWDMRGGLRIHIIGPEGKRARLESSVDCQDWTEVESLILTGTDRDIVVPLEVDPHFFRLRVD